MSNKILPSEEANRTISSTEPADKTFQFCNNCSMELRASPFLISALSLRIEDSDVIGVGSVVPALTLSIPKGKLYYNDADEFGYMTEERFKIFIYIDPEDDCFRIDLNRNTSEHFKNDDFGHIDSSKHFDSHYGADLLKVAGNLTKTSDSPDIVFKGKIPGDYPQQFKEPSFGVVSFEKISERLQ